jgi:hypothetical protein
VNLLFCGVAVVFLFTLPSQSYVCLYPILSYLKTVCATDVENEVEECVALYAIFQFQSLATHLPSISKYIKYYLTLRFVRHKQCEL